ncbi:MAG: hypothetical protein WCQ16_12645 [Verrucomicrobiae bacterium]
MPAKDRTLKTFGLNVTRLRAAKGISQQKLDRGFFAFDRGGIPAYKMTNV